MKKKEMISFLLCFSFYSYGQVVGTFRGFIDMKNNKITNLPSTGVGLGGQDLLNIAGIDEMLTVNDVLGGPGISATPSSGNVIIRPIKVFAYLNSIAITTSGTWVCPPGVTVIKVIAVGGGGGGGDGMFASTYNYHGAGAGGNSGEVIIRDLNVVPGTTYNIVVGEGAPENSLVYNGMRSGGSGLSSSFSGPAITTVSANGGDGGGGARSFGGAVTIGGVVSAGSGNNMGSPGMYMNGAVNVPTPRGVGGLGYKAFDGVVYGTGGLGGVSADTGYPGGAGAKGVVIIQY